MTGVKKDIRRPIATKMMEQKMMMIVMKQRKGIGTMCLELFVHMKVLTSPHPPHSPIAIVTG